VSCFEGDPKLDLPKDEESAEIWQRLGVPKERIVFYGAEHNWWSREGEPEYMRDGEPGGPDSEVYYEFTDVDHDKKYGEKCHPACDCGRFLEIGNSVFMTYRKVGGKFENLPKPNVDFGGGLERIAAAINNDPDIFKISLIKPIIDELERLSGKEYSQNQTSMRVIADHLRAATWLAVDGVEPSNKQQGYVMRRLLRRAIRYAFDLGIEQDLCDKIAPTVINLYKNDFPEVAKREKEVLDVFSREERIFRQTLRKGLQVFERITVRVVDTYVDKDKFSKKEREMKLPRSGVDNLSGIEIFQLYDTYGFPFELT
jgi:alanyl-tRNA synthetase